MRFAAKRLEGDVLESGCMEGGVRFRVRFGAAPTETGETSAQPGKTHLRSPRLLWSRVSKTVRLQLAVSNCFAKAIDAALCDGHQQHAGYLHKLKVGVLTRAQVARVVGDKRIETTQEELRAKIATGRVVVQASSEAELNAVEFWQQGDVDLSTAESLKARHRLKSDESVRAALHAWWAAVKANGLLTEDAAEPVLRREGYEIIFLRFHKLLLDTWNYDEAKATVAEDWIEDLGDSETRGGMPQEVFFASLFELADLWTPIIDAAVYAEFLRRLLASCFEAGGKLCSLDSVTFDPALTSDKSERKSRKSKSRRAKRHAQAVERQKAATRIQAHGRRKFGARKVEKRRKAAKLITARARAGIQGRRVRKELPPKEKSQSHEDERLPMVAVTKRLPRMPAVSPRPYQERDTWYMRPSHAHEVDLQAPFKATTRQRIIRHQRAAMLHGQGAAKPVLSAKAPHLLTHMVPHLGLKTMAPPSSLPPLPVLPSPRRFAVDMERDWEAILGDFEDRMRLHAARAR